LWIIPFASSQVMLGTPTVLVNNDPISAHSELIMFLLNCSSPIDLPIGHLICMTDVFVDVSWGDILCAMGTTLFPMGISFLGGKIGEGITKKIGGTISEEITGSFSRTTFKESLSSFGLDFGGSMASQAFISMKNEMSSFIGKATSREVVQKFGQIWTTTAVKETSSVLMLHSERELTTILTQKLGSQFSREFTDEFWKKTIRTSFTFELTEQAAEVFSEIFGELSEDLINALLDFLEKLSAKPPPASGTLLVT
jgi:hypothetical protein